MRCAATLRADLHDAFVFAGGGEHRLAFDDIDADRLLTVDVDAGLHGLDHGEGMPVIGRADQHDVEIFFLQHLAVIVVGARLFLRSWRVATMIGRIGKHLLVDIAKGHDFDGRDLNQAEEVGFAVPAGADQARRGVFFCLSNSCAKAGASAIPAAPAVARNCLRFME